MNELVAIATVSKLFAFDGVNAEQVTAGAVYTGQRAQLLIDFKLADAMPETEEQKATEQAIKDAEEAINAANLAKQEANQAAEQAAVNAVEKANSPPKAPAKGKDKKADK